MASPDYEGTRTAADLSLPDAGRCNVAASFPSAAAAEHAVQLLQERGLAEADVQLLASAEDALQPGSPLTANDEKITRSTVHDATFGLGPVSVPFLAGSSAWTSAARARERTPTPSTERAG